MDVAEEDSDYDSSSASSSDSDSSYTSPSDGLSQSSSSECSSDEENSDDACCAECHARVYSWCQDCDDGFCWTHMDEHEKKECSPATQSTPEGEVPAVTQVSPLLSLAPQLLISICKYLKSMDLVHLGQVCRRLRAVSRDRRAWAHVILPDNKDDTGSSYGPLRIAPALRTLKVGKSFEVGANLRRCTREVKIFVLCGSSNPCDGNGPSFNVSQLIQILKHYKGYLEVVRLGCLLNDSYADDARLLKAIKRLGIKELYIGGQLMRTYPGSSRVVTEMTGIGTEISGVALAHCLRGSRETLLTFKADPFRLDKTPWACASAPFKALQTCSALETACIPTWRKIDMLDAFPRLRTLCLYEFGYTHHRETRSFFKASAVMRQLHSLTLHLSTAGHRGLIRAVATGCPQLKELKLMFMTNGAITSLGITVDVARDLHVILGRMSDLEELTLYMARVPFMVFDGIAGGGLPNLRKLTLKFCAVTSKARASLAALRSRRPDVEILEHRLKAAIVNREYSYLDRRCPQAMCAALSDCDEEDPVSDTDTNTGKKKAAWDFVDIFCDSDND